VTGVLGEERAWARSWRDTNALAQTSLGEKKSGTSQSLRDCTRDEAASDSKSRRVTRVQRSIVPHVSSIDDLAAFAGGGNQSAMRICHDGRRFIRPTADNSG
jgi:hypothetical protein